MTDLYETVLSQTFSMNELRSVSQINLFRQGIELLRWTQSACQHQLALPDHVHDLDPGERHGGGPEGFEPEHQSRLPLNGSVILLDNIVEVFDLAHLDAGLGLGVVAFDRRRVGSALVDRDLCRRTVISDRLA